MFQDNKICFRSSKHIRKLPIGNAKKIKHCMKDELPQAFKQDHFFDTYRTSTASGFLLLISVTDGMVFKKL